MPQREGLLLAAAARTTSQVTPRVQQPGANGLLLVLDVTAASGTGGLRVILRAVDPVTAKVVKLHADPAAVLAVGTQAYAFGPGVSVAAGATGGGVVSPAYPVPVPALFDAQVAVGDATSYTYSLGYILAP